MARLPNILARNGIASDQALRPYLLGIELGQGFDSLTDGVAGNPWANLPRLLDKGHGHQHGHDVWYDVKLITDETSLRQTLDVSAAASFSTGAANASASLKVHDEIDITTYDVYLIVRCRVFNASDPFPVEASFNEPAHALWLHGHGGGDRRSAFVRAYGDEFVTQIVTGGEFVVALRIAASTEQDRHDIELSLAESGVTGGASFNLKATKDFSEKHYALAASIGKIGGSDPIPDPTIEAVLTAAHKFPDTVKPGSGYEMPFAFCTAKYVTRPQPDMVVDVDAENATDMVEDLAVTFDRLNRLRSAVAFARTNHVMFPPMPDADYRHRLDAIEDKERETRQVARRVADHRFTNLAGIHLPDVGMLPDAPVMATGRLSLRLHTSWETGNQTVVGLADEYCGIPGITGGRGTNGLVSLSISDVSLPPSHELLYAVHISYAGDCGPFKQGSSTTRGQIEGVYIWLTGPEASRYSVDYDVVCTDGEEYPGHDHSLAGSTLNWLRLNRVKVAITLKARL
jgi:hypothetical protein